MVCSLLFFSSFHLFLIYASKRMILRKFETETYLKLPIEKEINDYVSCIISLFLCKMKAEHIAMWIRALRTACVIGILSLRKQEIRKLTILSKWGVSFLMSLTAKKHFLKRLLLEHWYSRSHTLYMVCFTKWACFRNCQNSQDCTLIGSVPSWKLLLRKTLPIRASMTQ